MRITARPSITGDHTPASSGGKTRRLRTRMALVSLLAAGLLGVLGMASTTAIASTGMSTTITTAAVGAGAHAQALPMASLSHFSIDDIVCIYPQGCIFPYVCNSGSYPSPASWRPARIPSCKTTAACACGCIRTQTGAAMPRALTRVSVQEFSSGITNNF